MVLILYFTGTGNSEYVAKRIEKETEEASLNLFQKIKDNDYTELYSDKPWVVVVPTYAWRIPRIAEKWMEETVLSGNTDIYFVMTCGGNIGNAEKYLKALCSEKGMRYLGCFEIVMPENYIAMFSTPTKDEAVSIIEKAKTEMDKAIDFIKLGKPFPERHVTVIDKMNSGIVNDLFYPVFVHAKKFYATEDCISCGLCEKVCPLSNVRLVNGKPIWADNCTHCMACINRCPKEAIEYGKHSKGLPRYICPKG